MTIDGIYRRSASNGRTISVFKIDIKIKSQKNVRFGTRRPALSKRGGQYFEPLKTYVNNDNNVKAKLIPVTIGATGTISESLRQYLSDGPGKRGIKELRTAAILGTAHRLWEVLI